MVLSSDQSSSSLSPSSPMEMTNDPLQHLMVYNSNNAKKHQCSKCGLKFTRNSSLKRHIKSKHLLLKYKCDICPNYYNKRKDYLQRHMFLKHYMSKDEFNRRDYQQEFVYEKRSRDSHKQRPRANTVTSYNSSSSGSIASTVSVGISPEHWPVEFIPSSSDFDHPVQNPVPTPQLMCQSILFSSSVEQPPYYSFYNNLEQQNKLEKLLVELLQRQLDLQLLEVQQLQELYYPLSKPTSSPFTLDTSFNSTIYP